MQRLYPVLLLILLQEHHDQGGTTEHSVHERKYEINAIEGVSHGAPSAATPHANGQPPPAPASKIAVAEGWQYRDPEGAEHGPFLAAKLAKWIDQGYFSGGLQVRKVVSQGAGAWTQLKYVEADIRREAALTIVRASVTPNHRVAPSPPVRAQVPPPPPPPPKAVMTAVKAPPPSPMAEPSGASPGHTNASVHESRGMYGGRSDAYVGNKPRMLYEDVGLGTPTPPFGPSKYHGIEGDRVMTPRDDVFPRREPFERGGRRSFAGENVRGPFDYESGRGRGRFHGREQHTRYFERDDERTATPFSRERGKGRSPFSGNESVGRGSRGRGRGRGGRGPPPPQQDPDILAAVARLFTGETELGTEQPMWRYIDVEGAMQGPFPASSMLEWYREGYLGDSNLRVCGTERKVAPPNLPPPEFFIPLGALVYWVRRGHRFSPVLVSDIQAGRLPEELHKLKDGADKVTGKKEEGRKEELGEKA